MPDKQSEQAAEVCLHHSDKGCDDETVMISWLQSTLNAKQTAKIVQSWLPEEDGNYNIEAFV